MPLFDLEFAADPRKAILEALRKQADPEKVHQNVTGSGAGYKLAVIAVCSAIEATAQEDELWSTFLSVDELNEDHRIGEHLSATRYHFGIIS